MNLSQILLQVKTDFNIISQDLLPEEIIIADIALDSRLVKKNSVFFALKGKMTDGFDFIPTAINNGAKVVIIEKGKKFSGDALVIETSDVLMLLTEFLQIFYHNLPQNIYAITGTNGKTSVAEFSRQILQFLGKNAASIGTLGVICESEIVKELQNSSLTTPDIVSLYKNLQILKESGVDESGVDDVFLEVSSIALEQKRIAGLKIAVGAFTNFTQDHLDYHDSMANYFNCKMMLFDDILNSDSQAVLNSDIEQFSQIKKICDINKIEVIEYGQKSHDLRLQKVEETEKGQKVFFEFFGENYQFYLPFKGDFQVSNTLCALGMVLAKNKLSGAQLKILLQEFENLKSATGRMQRVALLPNDAEIFIDFAHSPDSLENVLHLARQISQGRVIVLFGCGGNRDPKKRPQMAEIACKLADFVIVTDDNPRRESPEVIRGQIMQNCNMDKTLEVGGREAAIKKAINLLEAGDTLILAGKGHEKYQIIGDQRIEFDEEKIVKNVIQQLS